MTDPREDIATRMAREAQEDSERQRRGPLIDFGGLQLGGKSSIFGIGFGWPEFLGFLAFWYGVVFGRSADQILTGIVYALAVWLPLRLLISGSQYLFGLFSKNADKVRPLPPLIAWPLIGLGAGALVGVGLVSLLGGDIAPMEGVVKFAPIGLVIGIIIGVLRRNSHRG